VCSLEFTHGSSYFWRTEATRLPKREYGVICCLRLPRFPYKFVLISSSCVLLLFRYSGLFFYYGLLLRSSITILQFLLNAYFNYSILILIFLCFPVKLLLNSNKKSRQSTQLIQILICFISALHELQITFPYSRRPTTLKERSDWPRRGWVVRVSPADYPLLLNIPHRIDFKLLPDRGPNGPMREYYVIGCYHSLKYLINISDLPSIIVILSLYKNVIIIKQIT
jgi:hypothetical protein